MLAFAVWQSESAICAHVSPPSGASLPQPSRWSQGLSWAQVTQRLPPALFCRWWCVCRCCPLGLSHPLLPPLYPPVHSLCLCLSSCHPNRFISIIFLDCTRMRSYMIFAFLSLTYFTLSDRLQVHSPQYDWLDSIPFLWLSDIPLHWSTTILYPSICWWMSRFLPCLGYCK